jgi:hypothetical protein
LRPAPGGISNRWAEPAIALAGANSKSSPAQYNPDLTPAPSLLRPHCLAKERLRLWLPSIPCPLLDGNGIPVLLRDEDILRIRVVSAKAYADSTIGGYGAGLLVYHVYCDRKEIPEEQRAPVSDILLSGFIATLAGVYAGTTISNYVSAIRAWHLIHGLLWERNKAQIDALLKAAKNLTPETSKKPKRQPYTLNYIEKILAKLDQDDSADATVHACLTTNFWASARVGETTVPSLEGFDPALHISIENVKEVVD